MDSSQKKTLWVGNLPDNITEELLYELFLQAGPLERVHVPKEKRYAFIQFKHEESVPYSARIMDGVSLYGKLLNIRARQGSSHESPTGSWFGRNSPDNRRMESNIQNRGSSPYDNSSPKNYEQYQNVNSSTSHYGNNSKNYNQQRQMGMLYSVSLPNMQPSSGRRNQNQNQRRHQHDSAHSPRSSHTGEFKGVSPSYRHEPYRRY